MIAADQPTCFPSDLRVAVSSRDDGTMLDRTLDNRHDPTILARRRGFTEQAGVDYGQCVYQIISYSPESTYNVIVSTNHPAAEGVQADALYTETPGVGLFLPVADCIATVVYDPIRRALMLAHIGRHASIAKLMTKVVDYMKQRGSNPNELIVWQAPSVGRDSYRMNYFDYLDDSDWREFAVRRDDGIYLDLSGYNVNLAEAAGVRRENIHTSPVDTARDEHYFSHSQGDTSGRFAVVAMMRD